MPKPYSQTRALWAITRASFKAIFNQPTAIVFSLLFPIIFILIFGSFGSGGGTSYKIAIEPGTDTSNAFFRVMKMIPQIRITKYPDTTVMNTELNKGRLTAIVSVNQTADSSHKPHFTVNLRSTSASDNTFG
jgi:ABC-2 type transport system permease protein